jgi:phage shock protein A
MAAQQVVVRIVYGSSVVDESIRRPVRLTPDGYAGVTYAGAVYPLLTDNVVDISGASWEVEDCNRFLLAGTPVPYAANVSAQEQQQFAGFDGEWNVETNRFGHYVVFNTSERVATGVVDALETAGLSVQRWDVSHRPASDGKFYDWFARLRFKGTRDEVLSRVAGVFLPPAAADAAVTAPTAPTPTRLEDLEVHVEQLLDQIVHLRERLDASEREEKLLRERLAAATRREAKLSGDLDRALEHQKSLHDQIAELSRSPEQSVDTKVLLAKQSDTEELLEFAFAENAELRNQLSAFRERAEQGETSITTLEATVLGLQERLEEIGEQERERRRAAKTRIAPQRGVSGFLDSAFARLTFVLDSVEVLANLDAPTAVMRSLVQIDMGEIVGRDLESARGWREVSKLATGIAGSEGMGRIYYKPGGKRVLVSVHVKQNDKEQRRHIERLRSL